jgi:hypothetical protein
VWWDRVAQMAGSSVLEMSRMKWPLPKLNLAQEYAEARRLALIPDVPRGRSLDEFGFDRCLADLAPSRSENLALTRHGGVAAKRVKPIFGICDVIVCHGLALVDGGDDSGFQAHPDENPDRQI